MTYIVGLSRNLLFLAILWHILEEDYLRSQFYVFRVRFLRETTYSRVSLILSLNNLGFFYLCSYYLRFVAVFEDLISDRGESYIVCFSCVYVTKILDSHPYS